jgi:hypothetical protein
MAYFMVIWYIFTVLVCSDKTNLATLIYSVKKGYILQTVRMALSKKNICPLRKKKRFLQSSLNWRLWFFSQTKLFFPTFIFHLPITSFGLVFNAVKSGG